MCVHMHAHECTLQGLVVVDGGSDLEESPAAVGSVPLGFVSVWVFDPR